MSIALPVIESARESDATALADRIAEMRPRLLALARSMRARDPEDLVQTTIEIALRHTAQLRDERSLWAWLIRIETREMFRWSRRLRLAVHSDRVTLVTPEPEELADLRRGLDSLPPRMRACLVLHYMADLTVADTAEVLGVTQNTVKTQLRLGLRRLKESVR